MTEHLSDLVLDQLRREGSEEGLRHLESCPRCQARQTELEAEDRSFDARFSVAGLAAETHARRVAGRGRRRTFGFAFASVAAAAAALLVVVAPSSELRRKGASAWVRLAALEEGTVTEGPDGVEVEAQSRLRLRILKPGFVRVHWGTPERWTALYPASEAEPWRLSAPGWMPYVLELDGDMATEWLRVTVCEQAMSEAEVFQTLMPGGCEVARIEVRKR